jgi:hypothetical protein
MELIGSPETYEPHFNIETGEYEDKSPFQAYDRVNNKIYMCKCTKKNIHNMGQFKSHIQNKGHLHWLRNYQGMHTHADHTKLATNLRVSKSKYLLKSRHVDELQKQNAELQEKLNIAERRYRMRSKQVEEQKRQIEILNSHSTIYNPGSSTMNETESHSDSNDFTDDDDDSMEETRYGSLD